MLYGSVTSMDIAEALKARGYEIDRRRIRLSEAIKETGEFSVQVRLHREVNVEIPVHVTGEGGVQADALAAEPGATGDAAATTDTAASEAAQSEETATE
jgi:large subunit ribosomal protein L9